MSTESRDLVSCDTATGAKSDSVGCNTATGAKRDSVCCERECAIATPDDWRAIYEGYLISLIDPKGDCHYRLLLHELHQMDFYWTVKNDDNRVYDALLLRSEWMERVGVRDILSRDKVSVLEVLVALARRLENDIMQDDAFGDRTPVWFWKFIHNLDLDHPVFNDKNLDEESLAVAKNNVTFWLDRKFESNGAGSIFGQIYFDKKVNKDGLVVDSPHPDARDVEIWSLAMTWLVQLPEEVKAENG